LGIFGHDHDIVIHEPLGLGARETRALNPSHSGVNMKNRFFLSASLVSVVLVGSVWAQSNGAMPDNHSMKHDMDSMGAMKATYVGCVESVNHGARFVLTQVTADAMKPARNKHDSKMEDMKHDEMKSGEMKSGQEGADMMVPAALALKAGSVDLRKHVGNKVSVTGSPVESDGADMTPTFVITSLKVVAKSCR
jgi:hypothetical protein